MKVIITGATGFVGEGVLLECLRNNDVSAVLMVNRKPSGIQHPKLRECIVADFMDLSAVKPQLIGYDACFYCAGISSVGLTEEVYTHITYDLTINFAKVMLSLNPEMVFNFVSGSHTDASEKGKLMWARVKGKAENALAKMPFKAQYNFRPGFMKPTKGQQNVKTIYKIIVPVFPLFFPSHSCTMQEVGLSMINAVLKGYRVRTLEISDIKRLAVA
ncbi:NAD-dependent epimerase/dehydratase family protein [Chitinophaga pinensis]|uniref:NAD-dependent epimerase/dehydratase family protein n=1 Tax=Chitinophaga pinensis TaxID=79329 RepID=A0A5C6LKA0_9BACT|nr:NAD-dependent epimerase/dehydratase family protein [Chitinophaga pinensis]TWV93338.1 NAD-dependent epimerase/dehydratase family protein [Chitinophaga pinensis]